VTPSVQAPKGYREDSPAQYRGALEAAWHPARPADALLKGPWWRVFGEPELDALEAKLEIDNQTIAQFFQNFMAARAQVDAARAGYYPTVTTSPSYTWIGNGGGFGTFAGSTGVVPGATIPTGSTGRGGGASTSSFFSIPVTASWAPDLWQRVRNTVRQARANAQVSAADLENERLTEEAALAEFYFQLRGQDALIDLYTRTIAADQQSLDYTRAQYETGITSAETVSQAAVTLDTAQATGVGLAINRAVFEHAIATLIGEPASEFSMPARGLTAQAPAIPVGIPSDVLQRRPDIAAAERTLAAANAQIGIAKAAYFPTVTLSSGGGLQATSLDSLFSAPSLFWSLGATVSETLFEGGLRRATVRQSEAVYRADVAAYRQTVLTAFQQVEDGLATLRIVSQQIVRQETAVKAARYYLDLAQASYQTGVTPYLDVINAQTVLLSNEQTLVTLRVNEMTAAVSLVEALGGGWDVSKLPP
jgi:NodT family efflux transporter outer membrane factor (OMF) lipoprotein